MVSSKHEKEVENQTQKQRNSQGGPVGIAKLKAMFERSPVSRSQSLGRRQASNPVPVVTVPCPALPIKRSKSLRIVGSGERNRLCLTGQQETSMPSSNSASKSKPPVMRSKVTSGATLRRRRSFESNNSPKPVRRSLHLDDDGRKLLQDCKDFLSRPVETTADSHQRIEGIVTGKGIRERRDSFRQAVSKKSELPPDNLPNNINALVLRSHASQRNQDAPDEVDGGSAVNHVRTKTNGYDHDEVDFVHSNVIIVKPDRASPKVDLYVKGLSGDAVQANPNRQNEKDCDPLKQIGLVWNRAATSIDLKSNLRNSDLTLQELKSCLRREGTAHELKLRKSESGQTVAPVKLYKSLDRVTKKDEGCDIQTVAHEWRPPVVNNVMGSPHRSPQTTVDRRNPLTVPSSPHRSPQTTVDRRNQVPNLSSPHHSPQTTIDRRHPLHASSSPHHSPQTTFDRRNPLASPHHSPQATVDRSYPLSSHASPHSSPQTTVDRRNPLSAGTSPHHSPQTTVDRRNPLSSQSSPHHSPQTTVDRRNHINQSGSVLLPPEASVHRRNHIGATQHSPQTSVDRRNSGTGPPISPQTTVDRRAPLTVSPHVSPQTTVDRRNPMISSNSLAIPPQMPQLQMLLNSGQINSSSITTSSNNHQMSQMTPHTSLQSMAVPLSTNGGSSILTTSSANNYLAPHASHQPTLTPLPASGGAQHRPAMSPEHQNLPRSSNTSQHRMNPHRPLGASPATPNSYEKKTGEPYSYGNEVLLLNCDIQHGIKMLILIKLNLFLGLVASVLRRGSQDDLALCVSGNNSASPKAVTNSQRPSAPPRIKRHASVVLPRKNGGITNISFYE